MQVELNRPIYGSDLVVWMMRALGIKYIALNPGSTFKHLIDSVVNYGNNAAPEVIQCTHEEISVAIAHGYAKASGNVMACATHDVVGLQHASMAIYNAYCDRAPVMILGGTGPMDITLRRPGIDWVHTALVQGELVRSFVKWDDQPASVAAIPESFLRGFKTATMHPQGPVYICYDEPAQSGLVDEAVVLPQLSRYPAPTTPGPDPDALRVLARWLVEAEAPLVIADYVGKDPRSVAALIELAELLALPVSDRGGRFNFPNNHWLDATGWEHDLYRDRDLVLALEMRDLFGAFHTQDTFRWQKEPFIPPSCKVASISLWELRGGGWAQDCQRITPIDLNIVADTTIALPMLLDECHHLIESKSREKYRRRFEAIGQKHEAVRERWRIQAKENWTASPVSTARLASEVWEIIKDEDWVLANGGLTGWPRRLWDFDKPYRAIGGSAGAGLGYGFSATVGAALAHRKTNKVIVNLQSDGDLMYAPGAFWTAAHHRLPILTVMFNNRSLYNSSMHAYNIATRRGRPVETRGIGTSMDDPAIDFAKLAEAQGVFAIGPIQDPDKVGLALRKAIKVVKEEQRPACVDVICQPR